MSVEHACPTCGSPLVDEALGGLCRKCLGKLGFGPANANAGGNGSQVNGELRRLGDYELIEEIARGGMGVVYKARQMSLNRIVAVKMILHGRFSSPEFVQRFQMEAKAVASLHHPNIVAIYEVGESDGQHYFSMEFIDGTGLADLVRDKPLPAIRAAAYVKAMAEAMHYAHSQGVLHRDLKPSNVLVDPFDQPRITDFGLAKLMNSDSQLTITGQALGSPNHMPPEQAAGRHLSSPAGDIYSLGAILYHLITGRPPFQGDTLQEVLLQVQGVDPVPPRRLNPSVPADLQTICLKCLQKDPTRRYSSAKALAEDLGRFLEKEPILARPVSPAQKAWLWCRRHPGPAVLSFALVLAVVGGLVAVSWEWARAERHALGESKQRRRAQDYADQVRLNLYAADVNLASQAIQRGDYGLARRTLAGLDPKPGERDLRGFEWRYLWNLCRGDELATLTGHTWIVTCASFSPDGHLLATGSQDGTARIWNTQPPGPVVTLNASPGAVWSTGFSPDGELLMTAGGGGVKFWRTGTWELMTNFPGQLACLSKTGSLVAIADSCALYWEQLGPVSLWDYRTGCRVRQFDRPGRALALSPDGKLLAVAGGRTGVNLWETDTGRLRRTLETESSVWSISFSPRGDKLTTAGWVSEALVWDLETDRPPAKLKGHSLTVWMAVFSPDGSKLLTASSDQTMRLWDSLDLRPRNIFHGHDNEIWCAAFSPDGKTLATGGKDQTVRLWPADLPAAMENLPQAVDAPPIFSPDGSRLALVQPDGPQKRGQLWDLKRGASVAEIPGANTIGFSPDGMAIVCADDRAAALEFSGPESKRTSSVTLAGIEPGKVSFVKSGLSPDRKQFFAIDQGGSIRLWETSTGKLLASLNGPKPPIRNAVSGPGGKHLALSIESENFVRLYAPTQTSEKHLSGHRDFVSGLAFSLDGATLASGSMDGTIRLWDTASGTALGQLPGHMEEVTDVSFCPDGRTLASVGRKNSVKFWHLATHRELLSLDFPQAGAYVRFSPDGRYLAVTAEDNLLRLFNAPNLAEMDANAH